MVLSQDEIDGTAPASSALRRRLECLEWGSHMPDRPSLFRTDERESAWTAVARDTGRRADDASRQKFSRERDTHEA